MPIILAYEYILFLSSYLHRFNYQSASHWLYSRRADGVLTSSMNRVELTEHWATDFHGAIKEALRSEHALKNRKKKVKKHHKIKLWLTFQSSKHV